MNPKNLAITQHCIQFLAAMCDGAQSTDGAGFSKLDAGRGKSLAYTTIPWDEDDYIWGLSRCKRYQKQLSYGGLTLPDFADLPKVNTERKIRVVEYNFELSFPYDQNLVNAVKELPGRYWQSVQKTWAVPIKHYDKVKEFARVFMFDTSDIDFSEIAGVVARLSAAPAPKEQPKTQPRIVKLNPKTRRMEFYFEYNPDIIIAFREYKTSCLLLYTDTPVNHWYTTELSTSKLPELLTMLKKEYGFDIQFSKEELNNLVATIRKETEPDMSTFSIPALGVELKDFQRVGVEYIYRTKNVLVGDQMGLGKTIEAIATMAAVGKYPVLIITPASVKYNWRKEIIRALPAMQDKIAVVNGGKPDPEILRDITIINYDVLVKWQEVLFAAPWHMIIADESHYLKSKQASRSKMAVKLMKLKSVQYRILLTGTPILNRPYELVNQLTAIHQIDALGGWYNFVNRYCDPKNNGFGTDYSGASNLVELNKRLREVCYLRREKEEVLKDLPKFSREYVSLPIDNKPEVNRAKEDIIKYIRELKGDTAAYKAARAKILVKINVLRQLTAKGKLAYAKEWIENFFESNPDDKMVLFAWHKAVIDYAMETFKEYNPVRISGETSAQERQVNVETFQNNPDCRIIICNIIAAGEGITLTAASNVVFLEHAWNPGKEEQAEARIHRIGQQKPCTAWYLDAEGTIDDILSELINSKRHVVTASVGNIDSESVDDNMLESIIKKLVI